MAGTCTMMLVDQGLLRLDEPLDKYLRALRGRAVPAAGPVTLRHLHTHTGGFTYDWDDSAPNNEERVADYYPHLDLGRDFIYCSEGPNLGGCVIESVTGLSMGQFYRKYLLAPLGCAHTEVTDCAGSATSTPLDMARLAQMLLNRGAYGDKRFFSEKTFEQMLPQDLPKLGWKTPSEYGIGTNFKTDGNILPADTFGLGPTRSAAVMRVAPSEQLVITICRNAAGRNFKKYSALFLQAIMDGIDHPTTAPAQAAPDPPTRRNLRRPQGLQLQEGSA